MYHQRYFFIKFETFKDLEIAITKGICKLPSKAFLAKMIKDILNSAYRTAEIILVFSVTGSHGIQGFGKMTSEARRRFFGIQVMSFLQDNCLPLKNLSKMPNPLHRNIPVAESQFGHELPPYIGLKVCSMIEELCQEQQLMGGGGFWNPIIKFDQAPPASPPPVRAVYSPTQEDEYGQQDASNSFFYYHPAHYIRVSPSTSPISSPPTSPSSRSVGGLPCCDHHNEICWSVFQKVKVNIKRSPFAKRCPFCDQHLYDYEYIYQEN
eukprot:TRINITY_DN4689_c0_g1_i4.p1 TRINITY_DN4689_c0_g1~~TRINITY_DN4689_c0_g1_i4.p1  ORF type:complete len:265 (-),score=44.51 TRINITY_DN4689_c0_g1_i4:115-909(-)